MPKTKTEPADDADDAVEDDAIIDADDGVEKVTIPFRGIDFHIPKDMDDWETEACLLIGSRPMAAAKILLGEQWPLLLALGSKRRDTNAFLEVMGAVVQAECIG